MNHLMHDEEAPKDGGGERRGLFREVLGTFFGVAPYVLAIIMWGSTVQERLRVTEIRLDHAENAAIKADVAIRDARSELFNRLDSITAKIEALQQSVARLSK